MRPQAIIILVGIFVVACLLLLLGPKGYEKLDDLQSLDAQTAAIREAFPEIEHVSPQTLGWIQKNAVDLLLVDVRKPEEFEVSHIEGAINLRTVEEVETLLEKRETAPSAIVVYGSIGKRSAEIADELRGRGHSQVRNLAGSVFRWANEGRPLVDGAGRPAAEVRSEARFQIHLLDPARRSDSE